MVFIFNKKIIFIFYFLLLVNLFFSCRKDAPIVNSSSSQTTNYDLKFPYTGWMLSSTPINAGSVGQNLFPEAELIDSLSYGYNRAKLAWYAIDPLYFKMTQNSVYTKQVLQIHVFPDSITQPGQSFLNTLDLSFYPNERGPYNYDFQNTNGDGTLKNPNKRWGGIMRRLSETNLEESKINFLDFWLMDPFKENPGNQGELFINLGDISEDILKDGKLFFENRIVDDACKVDTSHWGFAPNYSTSNFAFDNDIIIREKQDIGFDGMSDAIEQGFLASFLNNIQPILNSTSYSYLANDPSSDNFIYHQDASGDVFQRYKNINCPEGNSVNGAHSSTNVPESEDLNRDKFLQQTENYFQYSVELNSSQLIVGQNFIIGKQTAMMDAISVNWYHFKISISSFDKKIGTISDFKSIHIIRIFLTGFNDFIVLRFARLELSK